MFLFQVWVNFKEHIISECILKRPRSALIQVKSQTGGRKYQTKKISNVITWLFSFIIAVTPTT